MSKQDSPVMEPGDLYKLYEDWDQHKRFYRKARQALENGGISRYHRARLFGLLAKVSCGSEGGSLDDARRYLTLYERLYKAILKDRSVKMDETAFKELQGADPLDSVDHALSQEFDDEERLDEYYSDEDIRTPLNQMLNGHDDELVKSEMAEILRVSTPVSKDTRDGKRKAQDTGDSMSKLKLRRVANSSGQGESGETQVLLDDVRNKITKLGEGLVQEKDELARQEYKMRIEMLKKGKTMLKTGGDLLKTGIEMLVKGEEMLKSGKASLNEQKKRERSALQEEIERKDKLIEILRSAAEQLEVRNAESEEALKSLQ